MQAQINQHKLRIEQIGETLSQRRGNRQGGGEQQKLKSRLNDLSGQFKRELVRPVFVETCRNMCKRLPVTQQYLAG